MLKYLIATCICLCLGGVKAVFGQALKTRVDISAKNIPIKEVLQSIEARYTIRFSYSDDVVPVKRLITLNLKNIYLDEALSQIFANTFIDFMENENQILFFRKKLNLDPQKVFSISGFVLESSSGEPLVGVNIMRMGTAEGTSTNTYGYYSMSANSDTFHLQISYVGYETVETFILLDQNIQLNISLKDRATFKEVVVQGKKEELPQEISSISTLEIPIQQIQELPALFGEKDVFKVFKLMPGVQSGSEGQAGMYVRGGGPDQNLIILDDATVYNAFHLFGLFSLFNGDALRSAELTKGGFPARYGGRLSSVMDVHMKDGNKQEFHGSGAIGLLSSSLTLEGPIKKDVSSFLITGRRMYLLDLLVNPFLQNQNANLTFYFYDITAKANWVFSDKNKVYLSFYNGRDRYKLSEGNAQYKTGGGINWENITSTLRWNHVVGPRLFMNTSLIFSKYNLNVGSQGIYNYQKYETKLYSGIADFSAKVDFDYKHSTRRSMKFGAVSTYHYFTPQGYYELNELNKREISSENHFKSQENAVYIEDQYHFSSRLVSESGIRFSHFYATGKNYIRAEPRLGLRFEPTKHSAFKLAYSIMNQYVHLLSNTGINLPTDLWVPTTSTLGPQTSQQIAAGYSRTLKKLKANFSVEAYYKKSKGVIGYKEGASFIEVDNTGEAVKVNWERNVTQGQSWSYGAEFLVQKKLGKFTGWVGYTLSWTFLQFDELNRGEKFYARYDRRHDVSVVGTYHFSERITLSATWVYGTGNAITLPESKFFAVTNDPSNPDFRSSLPGQVVTEYGLKNQYRMSPYHRMDIGVQFHKKKKYWDRTWEISLYNAYNRKNPYYYFVATDKNGKNSLKEVSLFPILPSVSYSFKF